MELSVQMGERIISRREEEENDRTRWLSFEAAIELRDRIESELGWPYDLISVERGWRGEDDGNLEVLNGFRVVLACPFPEDRMPEPPMARVRDFPEAEDFLKVALLWRLRSRQKGRPQRKCRNLCRSQPCEAASRNERQVTLFGG